MPAKAFIQGARGAEPAPLDPRLHGCHEILRR